MSTETFFHSAGREQAVLWSVLRVRYPVLSSSGASSLEIMYPILRIY